MESSNLYLYEIIRSDLRAICISDFDDAKADAVAEVQQTGASSSSKDTPMTPHLLGEWRKTFFNLYMEHASEQVHKIPGILEYGHSSDTQENTRKSVVWEHAVKGVGRMPSPIARSRQAENKRAEQQARKQQGLIEARLRMGVLSAG